MHAWEAIQKSVDYIEDHLAEDIEMDTLAKVAALSPFYFQRLFSRLVQKPVREYIRLRRLARASRLLPDKQLRILDIALDCGFGSHEGFTRAFKEAYGQTPEQYRQNPRHLNHFDKPDLLLGYVMVDEDVPLITEGLVLEFNHRTLAAPIHFLGVKGYVPIEGQMPLGKATGVDVPGEVWDRFHREKKDIPRIPGGREIGVAWQGDAPSGHFSYYAGAEVAAGAETGPFEPWQLPPREYIVCGFEAENFEQLTNVALNEAVTYSGTWLEHHGYSMELYSPEMYYDSTPEGCYMELWMPYIEAPL